MTGVSPTAGISCKLEAFSIISSITASTTFTTTSSTAPATTPYAASAVTPTPIPLLNKFQEILESVQI
jgi:hypothetical protein